MCVSVSVCLALTAERTDVQTWILACRSSGKISRSSLKVKVIGQRSTSPGQTNNCISSVDPPVCVLCLVSHLRLTGMLPVRCLYILDPASRYIPILLFIYICHHCTSLLDKLSDEDHSFWLEIIIHFAQYEW